MKTCYAFIINEDLFVCNMENFESKLNYHIYLPNFFKNHSQSSSLTYSPLPFLPTTHKTGLSIAILSQQFGLAV